MTKIRALSIDGLRGVRGHLSLSLQSKSALMYGDNGTGKSTLSDVVEWFYLDKVDHLVSEEIGRKGYEALRNTYLADTDPATVGFKFDNTACDCTKSIEVSGEKLKSSLSNSSEEFLEYLSESRRENLVLRYRDLLKFVISSKGERLRNLSEIIGFSDVTKTRDVLRKIWNQISRDIASKDFQNQISYQQRQIVEQFSQNVTTDEKFIKVVNALIKDFDLNTKVKSLKDIDTVLTKIKRPGDSKEAKQEAYLSKLEENFANLPANLDQLEEVYKEYEAKFDDIVGDIEKIRGLALEQLLRTGRDVLVGKKFDGDICPLCLQNKNVEDLVSELNERLNKLEEIKAENQELRNAKGALDEQIQRTRRLVQLVADDVQCKETENLARKKELDDLIGEIDKFGELLTKDVSKGDKLSKKKLLIDRKLVTTLAKASTDDLAMIRKEKAVDPKWDVHSKIKIASHAYAQIRNLEREEAIFEIQRNTMEELYKQFVQAQKKALASFLTTYSCRIDQLYQLMNPGERVENIGLSSLERDGDLIGLTIQYDFLNEKAVSPPQKYLSESHLNCLGLAIFLTSVEAFNNRNKFVVLDDVISSFDSEHRKRFADLIVEEYSDYQVILLTHERAWFDIVRIRAKQKGWQIYSIKHNDKDGTHLGDPPKSLKGRIGEKLASGEGDGLGNDARKYLESLLKKIAQSLEVKVAYRANDVNEDRMSNELLSELKSKLKKVKCTELSTEAVIDRLFASTNIGNKDSHDYFAGMEFGDLKAFWQDIENFENLFCCNDCKSMVSVAHFDSVNNKVRCRKGHINYTWHK